MPYVCRFTNTAIYNSSVILAVLLILSTSICLFTLKNKTKNSGYKLIGFLSYFVAIVFMVSCLYIGIDSYIKATHLHSESAAYDVQFIKDEVEIELGKSYDVFYFIDYSDDFDCRGEFTFFDDKDGWYEFKNGAITFVEERENATLDIVSYGASSEQTEWYSKSVQIKFK